MRKILGFIYMMLIFTGVGLADTTGRGGLFFGKKNLDRNDWGALDQQSAWGINLDVKETSWPIWATLGYVNSRDKQTLVTSLAPYQTTTIEGKTYEIHAGVKKDFNPLRIVRISIAGGPAFLHASLDSSLAPYGNDSDGAAGVWAGADAFLYIGHLVLGVSYQYSHGTVHLFDESVDAGGNNLSFAIGVGW